MIIERGLKPLGPGIWTADDELRVMGMAMPVLMTVVDLPSGLWLHSPVALEPLRAAVEALEQPVAWRVAPNLMHHLFQAPWRDAFPDSRLAAPAGLAGKRPDLRIDAPLTGPLPAWDGRITGVPIAGNPVLDETVFLHRDSRTLMVTDLAVNLGPGIHWGLALYARLNGCHGRLAVSFMLKMLYRDKAAARRSVEAVLDLDFDRVVPAHGGVVETGGKDALAGAMRWLLKK
ncbi:MAG: hypothetical protein PHS60_07820 [Zavarzinia sp.]|nr:hypothetical protein [Zavarzinia sp.]